MEGGNIVAHLSDCSIEAKQTAHAEKPPAKERLLFFLWGEEKAMPRKNISFARIN
jgi:hypothetical protein